ncbi:MAG: polyprenyl synthetase family protein [Candidatus Bathyarchaeia archaeon]
MKKQANKKLMEQVQIFLKKRGQKAFEIAKKTILQEKNMNTNVYKALRYFMEECWYDVQHPALISLTCEAVGGNPEKTSEIGAAIVLLAGAADIHDDIIDESKTKNSKPTVFGKFNKDIALLAGDALLFEGLVLLHKACKKFPEKIGTTILKLTKEAFFDLGRATAKERNFKGKYDLEPKEYCNIIKIKAAIAEACAKIGAVIGGGESEAIDALGNYGRTLGILMTLRDEFIDLFEPEEIKNRAKNEILPLPLLYALQNETKKNEILSLIKKKRITEQKAQELIDLVTKADEVQKLKKEMQTLIKTGEKEIFRIIKKTKNKKLFNLLLQSSTEDLP